MANKQHSSQGLPWRRSSAAMRTQSKRLNVGVETFNHQFVNNYWLFKKQLVYFSPNSLDNSIKHQMRMENVFKSPTGLTAPSICKTLLLLRLQSTTRIVYYKTHSEGQSEQFITKG